MVCPQCNQPVSFWRQGLLTGLCPMCQAAPSEQIKSRIDHVRAKILRVLWGSVAGLVVLAVMVTTWLTPVVHRPVVTIPFSSEGWCAGDAGIRGQMAHDLISLKSHLMGKSPEEVWNLLGVPDTKLFGGQTLRFRVDVGWRWITEPAPCDLVVRFGKGNEVVDVSIEPKYE